MAGDLLLLCERALDDLFLASGLRDLDLESDLLLVSLSLRSVVGEVNWVGWELELLLILDYLWIKVWKKVISYLMHSHSLKVT